VARLGDHERVAAADDARGLAQDHLELARVAVFAGELDGQLGRLDAGERDDASLGFRDDLLGEHEHVAVLELDGRRDERGEVVALPDLRQALDRPDLDHGRPVTRSPAAPL
jgi:hypothetical protein